MTIAKKSSADIFITVLFSLSSLISSVYAPAVTFSPVEVAEEVKPD